MFEYDPDRPVDPAAWLAIDEGGRIALARNYHREHRIALPQEDLHAALHATVENQLAQGLLPARQALERLIQKGETRHAALHIIGLVLAELLHELYSRKGASPTEDQILQAFGERLARLK